MKAVILAGGLGKRLRPITEEVPKPLVPVNGRPVVEYTMENLPDEVTDIVFVIGYRGDMIQARYGDNAFGRRVEYVEQKEQLGTGHAVKCAREKISEPFLLLYGDDVYGAEGLSRLARNDWALLARRVDHPERFGVLVTREDGTVESMVEKPKEFVSDLTWVGAAALCPDFLTVETELSERGEYEATDMVNILINSGTRFAVETTDLWFPANTKEEVGNAEKEILRALAKREPA